MSGLAWITQEVAALYTDNIQKPVKQPDYLPGEVTQSSGSRLSETYNVSDGEAIKYRTHMRNQPQIHVHRRTHAHNGSTHTQTCAHTRGVVILSTEKNPDSKHISKIMT